MKPSPANQQEETIMTTIALKIAQRAILAAAFLSTAAFAEPVHENITVTPAQENVWGAKIDVPNQQQAYVTENVWGAQIRVPASQVSVASAPAQQAASADQAAQNAVFQGN
jgi:hypothetical protein